MQFDIQVLIEIQLVSIGAFLLESSVVLFILSYNIRFIRKKSCRFQIENETSKMSGSNEVLNFIVVLQGILVHEELMRLVHSANSHITA